MSFFPVEHDEDVRRAISWLLACSAERAATERLVAARSYYRKSVGLDSSGRYIRETHFLYPRDLPYAYLSQAIGLISCSRDYDSIAGSAIVPFFKAIGMSVADLARVEGAPQRAAKMMKDLSRSPDSALFELATAARYLREGFDVAFVPETPGRGRSPDLKIVGGQVDIGVECKRLRLSDYEQVESAAATALFSVIRADIARRSLSVVIDVIFYEEVTVVPASYLNDHLQEAIKTGRLKDYRWSDPFGSGTISPADIATVHEDTKNSSLLVGPKLTRLLAHRELPPSRCLFDIQAKRSELDPRYVHDVRHATLFYWQCRAETSVNARARWVRSKLAEVDRQVAGSKISVAHIGMEAEREPETSDLKRRRNHETIAGFRPKSLLVNIFAHYFMPRESEMTSWMIDEMVDKFSRGEDMLLDDPRILPGAETFVNAPWRESVDWKA